jgi:hypothetical protein
MAKAPPDQYSAEEAARRFKAALRGAQVVGHKTHEESRPGTPRPKRNSGKVAKKTKAKKMT